MNTALQQQRLEVEQLRREAAMKRIPVSQAVEDIKVRKLKIWQLLKIISWKHKSTNNVYSLEFLIALIWREKLAEN